MNSKVKRLCALMRVDADISRAILTLMDIGDVRWAQELEEATEKLLREIEDKIISLDEEMENRND